MIIATRLPHLTAPLPAAAQRAAERAGCRAPARPRSRRLVQTLARLGYTVHLARVAA